MLLVIHYCDSIKWANNFDMNCKSYTGEVWGVFSDLSSLVPGGLTSDIAQPIAVPACGTIEECD